MIAPPHPPSRILFVGCGGIGGVLSATLYAAGRDVHLATTNAEVRARWTLTGPYLNGHLIRPALPTNFVFQQASEAQGVYDIVFVAVQPPQITAVAQQLMGKLSARGRVVCLSNGLCEPYLAEVLGTDRVLGAVVAWGARMPRPGFYVRTSRGGFLLGSLCEQQPEVLASIERELGAMGPVKRTQNLTGARFSKLTLNCAISALGTIGGDTLGALLLQPHTRDLALYIMREAIQVARAQNIVLEKIAGLDLEKLVGEDSGAHLGRTARHALLLVVGARYRRLRSSMLAAVERGRPPAVDFLNGEISARGKRLGVPTPYNDAAHALIWSIYNKQQPAGEAALQELARLAVSQSGP